MTYTGYDWFNLTEDQLAWLIRLYDWDTYPIPNTYAISKCINFVEQLGILGLVESPAEDLSTEPVTNKLVRITEHGKRYLENTYPVEVLLSILCPNKQSYGATDMVIQKQVKILAKKFPLAAAPVFLAHSHAYVREIGQAIVDSHN